MANTTLSCYFFLVNNICFNRCNLPEDCLLIFSQSVSADLGAKDSDIRKTRSHR